ncbi:MAG: lycopene cyclase family protein [Myxococcota bacterium]|nr:lycopene cyclase family protein [Myxococcota bacterium]
MSEAPLFDHLVLGGGCAGLSLAVELAARRPRAERIAVVEPRTAYRRDRTWCSWDLATHRFESAVSHSWCRWKLRLGGVDRVHASARYRYREIPADRFYALAVERLSAREGCELHLGAAAHQLAAQANEVRVETDAGPLRGRFVYDARPGAPGDEPPELLQHFVGWRVRAGHEVFDPRTVTLMDFDVSQDAGIHFVYVLPHSTTEALVESTFLSPRTLPREHYHEAIDRYLGERYRLRKYEIFDAERGVIPMTSARPTPRVSDRVFRIGTGGGLVKPSTGYAFLAIQRFSRALVDGLDAGGPDARMPRTRLARMMDAIFLDYLRNRPERAPDAFRCLFERVEPDALVRFLGDAATPRDRLAVIRALPVAPLLAAAWRARRRLPWV